MKRIQQAIFETFSVRIDVVQHGSGTSINGNAARKCLKDHATLASILNLDGELVKRLSFVLLAFRQKDGINLDRLQQYCDETYQMYFEKYPWGKMNPTVHKMLRHGPSIAREFPLSLAYFAEDAAESMHKMYKKKTASSTLVKTAAKTV